MTASLEDALRTMQLPERWPLRVVLALAHTKRKDAFGLPVCGFVALGHGPRVYLANVGDLGRAELLSRAAFDEALKRIEVMCYLSFEAIVYDGWRVD